MPSKTSTSRKRKGRARRLTAKRWIQGAVRSPGALHVMLHVPQGQVIPLALLREADKDHGLLGKRARLAKTLRALRKKIRGNRS